MAAIVNRETPKAKMDNESSSWNREGIEVTSSLAMYTGCTILSPTRRSQRARLHQKTVDGERSEGVLSMVDNTSTLPVMDMSISGAVRMQFMMTMVSG